MDYLRKSIHLRGYAQKDPKQEYKKESFQMFTEMLETLKFNVVSILTKVQVRTQEEIEAAEKARMDAAQRAAEQAHIQYHSGEDATENSTAGDEDFSHPKRKIGRNEPCPCGSGKKYKHCHGRIQ